MMSRLDHQFDEFKNNCALMEAAMKMLFEEKMTGVVDVAAKLKLRQALSSSTKKLHALQAATKIEADEVRAAAVASNRLEQAAGSTETAPLA